MLRPAHLCLLLGAAVPFARPASPQGFQGVVTERHLRIRTADLMGEGEGEEQPSPEKVLAMPIEPILAKVRAGALETHGDTSTLELKGTRMRASTTALKGEASSYWISDSRTGVFWSVSPSQRVYTEMTPEDFKKLRGDDSAAQGTTEAPPKLEPLGTTKAIAGFRCAGYRYTSDGESSIAWLSKDLADVATAYQRMAALWMSTAGAKGAANPLTVLTRLGFPCLVQSLETHEGEPGATYSVTELLSVERKALPDDRFVLPAGFRKMALPQ